ncbi:hypothetical protein E4U30_002748 [Claviceps sp. LM220 group G6]|nr:hypothetical protein E4U30_002748 [Claviceps sp. LM220 group G6]
MSIFSSLRKSRQRAKEHNAKLAEQKEKEQAQIPYKHVPTHAAADAFASAPPSWREADRARIVEQNRRRSAMAANGHHMNMPGVPRVGSSLSRVSYPGEDMTPAIRLPRAYSYTGVSSHTASARESREMMYSTPQDMTYTHVSRKGKEVPRVYDTQRLSPTSSKSTPSQLDSSDGSTSSHDDLEIKLSKPKTRSVDAIATHRLHPSHARRKSDASIHQYALSSTSKHPHSGTHRDSRPPPSMRGFASIPAVAAIQSTNLGGSSTHLPPHGYSGRASSIKSSRSDTLLPSTRQSSATSLSGLSNGTSKQPASTQATAHTPTVEKKEHSIHWISLPEPDMDVRAPSIGTAPAPSHAHTEATAPARVPQPTNSVMPNTKVRRPQQLDCRPNNVESQTASFQQHVNRRRPISLARADQLANVFPEMAIPETQEKPGKQRRLSKVSAGNFLRKNRWSTSKVPALLV